jgi:hypothetical protein
MSEKKTCEYDSPHHSDDLLEVWHGAATPRYLCGYHEMQGKINELTERIRAAS